MATNNRLDQLMQMKEQMDEQIRTSTANMEMLMQEVDLVKQNLVEVNELIGDERRNEHGGY